MRGGDPAKDIKGRCPSQGTHADPQEHRQAPPLPAQVRAQPQEQTKQAGNEGKGNKGDELNASHRIDGIATIVYLMAGKRRAENPPQRTGHAINQERTRE